MLFELSPEQEKLIPIYREKWQNIALSTEAIAPDRAREAVESAYIAVGKAIPEIVFVDSPLAASQIILDWLKKYQIKWLLMNSLNDRLDLKLSKPLIQNIKQKVLIPIWGVDHWLTKLKTEHQYIVEIQNKIRDRLDDNFSEVMLPKDWTSLYSLYDFCISILGYDCNSFVWNSFESIMKYCGYIYGFEDICIICDRPKQWNLDRDFKLHAEGKPAIEFSDGFSLYFYHGIALPEKYGKKHPTQWSIELFLEIQESEIQEIFARQLGLKIQELTPKQEVSLPNYINKWNNASRLTDSSDRDCTITAINNLYEFSGLKNPDLVFCDSPISILKAIKNRNPKNRKKTHFSNLFFKLYKQIEIQIDFDFSISSITEIDLGYSVFLDSMANDYYEEYEKIIGDLVSLNSYYIVFFDYCINELHCVCDRTVWNIYRNLVLHCSWIFPYEEVCFVCDRPQILSFDSEDRLHAEGKPAVEFADGFSIYAYHGVRLPEKYGKYPPSQWRSQWLLSEENAESRRALIQGIGYAKICQELQAVELDTWREYSLLGLDVEFAEELDEEPIYLLKMTCPSTRHIHVLRVPPTMNSAREAIAWVNWDIDPEEFSVQT